jgi:hypothetical protein
MASPTATARTFFAGLKQNPLLFNRPAREIRADMNQSFFLFHPERRHAAAGRGG